MDSVNDEHAVVIGERRYLLEINEEQARALERACDAMSRIVLGDYSEANRLMIEYIPSDEATEEVNQRRRDARSMLNYQVPNLQRLSHEVHPLLTRERPGGPYQPPAVSATLYDLQQVIRHELWQNGPRIRSSVDAYPARQTGTCELATIRTIETTAPEDPAEREAPIHDPA